MENISSLNSPQIARVKALLGPRGKKNRESESTFIVEGLQATKSALMPKISNGFAIQQIFLTDLGHAKLVQAVGQELLNKFEVIKVSDQVMNSMADSKTPQGILALASTNSLGLRQLWDIKPKRIAFFWQMQDPGNAGTVIRTADACGFDAVIFSTDSVDVFNPKTVRATVGSLWHIPVVNEVTIEDLLQDASANGFSIYALCSTGSKDFKREFIDSIAHEPTIWIFGNEARGLPELPGNIVTVSIPMNGHAESLNVASAAAIVLHSVGIAQ